MVVEAPIIASIKTILSWVAIPAMGFLTLFGFHYKRQLLIIDELKKAANDARVAAEISKVQIQLLHEQIIDLKDDIRRVENRLCEK